MTACIVTVSPAGFRVCPAPEHPLRSSCQALCTAQAHCTKIHVCDLLADFLHVLGVGEGTAVLLLHERGMHQGEQVRVQTRKHRLLKWHTTELHAARRCQLPVHFLQSCQLCAAVADKAFSLAVRYLSVWVAPQEAVKRLRCLFWLAGPVPSQGCISLCCCSANKALHMFGYAHQWAA